MKRQICTRKQDQHSVSVVTLQVMLNSISCHVSNVIFRHLELPFTIDYTTE